MQQAKGKAELLASAAGATLGPAITIVESGGVTPVSAPQKGAAEDAPAPPVEPGASTVQATVEATFGLL